MVTLGTLIEQSIALWQVPKESKQGCYLPPSLPEAEREVCNIQRQKARGCCNLCPRGQVFHQTVSRLPVVNQDFLGSWKVHISQDQECHSLRSVPQRRHTAYQGLQEAEQSGRGRFLRCTAQLGQCTHQELGQLSCLDLSAQNTQPICDLMEHPQT